MNKYLPCHGMDDTGLVIRPPRRDPFDDYTAAVRYCRRMKYTHLAHINGTKTPSGALTFQTMETIEP